jgi:hypothetical protein
MSDKAIGGHTTSNEDTELEVETTPQEDIKRFMYLDRIV